MQKITSSFELNNAIALLEIEHKKNSELLEIQIKATFDSFTPVNILKNTIENVFTTPMVRKSLLSSIVGIASGYFSKKIVVGSSHNTFREILGSILQLSVTNSVAGHPEIIGNVYNFISNFFTKKNKSKPNDK